MAPLSALLPHPFDWKRTIFFFLPRCTDSSWNVQKSGNAREKVKTYSSNIVTQPFKFFFYANIVARSFRRMLQ